MADPPPEGTPADPRDVGPALPPPARTPSQSYDRTWELELLISGAVAFTLLQVPGAVDPAFDRLGARLGPGLFRVATFGYIYLKIILYALITTFVVHLVARAYWVGLVGLASVFPGGIRWDQTRFGPATKRFYQDRLPGLQAQSDAVDRFCSILFSFASVLVLTFVSSTLFVTVLGGISWLVAEHLGWSHVVVFYVALAAVAAPIVIASQVDKRIGDRLDDRQLRWLRGALRVGYWAQLGALTAAISNVLFSNIRRVKAVGLFYLAFASLIGFFMVKDVMIRMGGASLHAYEYLPDQPDSHTLSFWYYENQQQEGRLRARYPSIQADIIREPFVRLFLPYYPRRHNELIEERCTQVATAAQDRDAPAAARRAQELQRAEGVFDCLASLQPITLNGEPLRDLRSHFYTHPRTGLRGTIAYIPTAGLPPGENLLIVEAIPIAERSRRGDEEMQTPHFIPFWIAPSTALP